MTIDLESAPVERYTPDDAHTRLASLAGPWRGTARTTFEPGSPVREEAFEGHASVLLGGRFARLTYTTRLDGKSIAGELTIAYEAGDKRWTASWIDSFHTGTSILVSQGEPGAPDVDVRGTYHAGEGQPRWGWRTRIDTTRSDALVVRMDNVSPDGTEYDAVLVELRRS